MGKKRKGRGRKKYPVGTPAPEDDFWYSPVGSISASGVSVTPDSALRNPALLSGAKFIAQTIASLPLKIFRRLPNGGKREALNHPLYSVLHSRPNVWQTSFEFRELQQLRLIIYQNAYAEIVPGARGAVDQLIPLHPRNVKPVQVESGRVNYEVTNSDGTKRTLTQDEMFHVRGLSLDGVSGAALTELGRDSIGLGLAAEEFGNRLFSNGGDPGGVIRHPGSLSQAASDRLKESWEKAHRGLSNAHKTAILEEGMEYKQIGMTSEAAQFLETRRFQVLEMARLLGIPPMYLQDYEATPYNNSEQASISLTVHCVRPWAVRWEQAISRDLILSPDLFFPNFSLEGLLRGDFESRNRAYAVGWQNGWLSTNDILRLEDMDPIEGGDEHFVPRNMMPMSQALAEAEQMKGDLEGRIQEIVKDELSALRALLMRGVDGDFARLLRDFFDQHVERIFDLGLQRDMVLDYVEEGESALRRAVLSGDGQGILDSWEEKRMERLIQIAGESHA